MAVLTTVPIMSNDDFDLFRRWIYIEAGIDLSISKRDMVSGRLMPRLKHYNITDFRDYFALVNISPSGESKIAVDLLTTNETSFFREKKHFDYIVNNILTCCQVGTFRAWSAASSTGEEAYTLAMVLAESSDVKNWNVVGSDISTRAIDFANAGRYSMERINKIPDRYLRKYCLKGVDAQKGYFIIDPELRRGVNFVRGNLLSDQSCLGKFDVVLLRNVLIYFDVPTVQKVISQVTKLLKSNGHLIIGHSETLNEIDHGLSRVMPSIYRN